MKQNIHPKQYRQVVFQDLNNGNTFITRSTAATDEKIKLEGQEYPLVKVHISSSSHPFFTGEERIVDVEGRVDKFKARQEAAKKAQEARVTSKPKAKKSVKEEARKLGEKTTSSTTPASEPVTEE